MPVSACCARCPRRRRRRSKRFRREARALGTEWAEDLPYGQFVRGLDRTYPRHLALIHEATALFRGAGYTAFDGELPEQRRARGRRRPLRPRHRAAATPRRPLRPGRLRGRCRGAEVPDAVRAALPLLPELMRDSDRRAAGRRARLRRRHGGGGAHGREGETFGAIVVDHTDKGMEVQLDDLPVSPGSPIPEPRSGPTCRSGSTSPTCAPADQSVQPRVTATPTWRRMSRSGGRVGEQSPPRNVRAPTGQGGGQQPPGVTRGTVPQRTDRHVTARAAASKGETVV